MRPLERLLLSITPKAWETRPSAVAHSLVISPALATPLWGITLSSATTETIPSRTDLTTVHLERLRSLTIPLAITTASSVRLHFNSILPAKPIRPLVMVRSKEIPPATLIPRVVFEHSSATPLVAKNTATGAAALANNTTGSFNTANGSSALGDNTTGIRNTANGEFALGSNATGNETLQTEQKCSLTTPLVTTTRLPARSRSTAILPGSVTRPSA